MFFFFLYICLDPTKIEYTHSPDVPDVTCFLFSICLTFLPSKSRCRIPRGIRIKKKNPNTHQFFFKFSRFFRASGVAARFGNLDTRGDVARTSANGQEKGFVFFVTFVLCIFNRVTRPCGYNNNVSTSVAAAAVATAVFFPK